MEPERPKYDDPKTIRRFNEKTVLEDAGPQDHVPWYEQRSQNKLFEGEREVTQNQK